MEPSKPKEPRAGWIRATLARDHPEYKPLEVNAAMSRSGAIETEWKPTDEELAVLLEGGTVRVTLLTFHHGFPPITVEATQAEGFVATEPGSCFLCGAKRCKTCGQGCNDDGYCGACAVHPVDVVIVGADGTSTPLATSERLQDEPNCPFCGQPLCARCETSCDAGHAVCRGCKPSARVATDPADLAGHTQDAGDELLNTCFEPLTPAEAHRRVPTREPGAPCGFTLTEEGRCPYHLRPEHRR